MEKSREVWVDWLRVTACFLVMMTHSSEPFYLGGEGSLILTRSDAIWVSVLNVIPRACVALFVIASSYLQFPIHYDTRTFFRRRAVRVLVPFAFWSVVYALVWGEPVQNFKDLLLNFNYAAGHLWFVYMLIGIYLLMPLLSPWAARVGKKELQFYLLLCFATTLIPLVRQWVGGAAPVIYGPSGIPNAAKYPLWGEASWNSYGLFYYFSGFIGYLLLGLYFRRFAAERNWGRTIALAAPLFLAGFGICCAGFLHRVWADCGGSFPVEGPVGLAALWEGPWLNDTAGVALMAVAWVLVFRKIGADSRFFRGVVLPVSQASYGMYLCHMLILGAVSAWLRGSLGIGVDGILGIWTTPVQIISTAIISFTASALFCLLVRRIPKAGKLIIG
ncbi:MAG: acyltransferase family protein [Bacteroidales bacterium]|nr:acyltransferase family protein [Bacteroidales bacterium]